MAEFLSDAGLKMLLAVALGGAVGLERELLGKPAGLRTNILIALGSTVHTLRSMHLAGPLGDQGRIAAQIVSGVGFIGAGTIIQASGAVVGLTSAATIWAVAAIGIAVGSGMLQLAIGATVTILLCLTLLRRFDYFGYGHQELITFELRLADVDRCADVVAAFDDAGLKIEHSSLLKTASDAGFTVRCSADTQRATRLMAALAARDGVLSASFSSQS